MQRTSCQDRRERLRVNDAALPVLDLHGLMLDVATTKLGEALASNSASLSLELCENDIGVASVEFFGESLSANSVLQDIDLSADDIGAEGAGFLREGRAKNGSLKRL